MGYADISLNAQKVASRLRADARVRGSDFMIEELISADPVDFDSGYVLHEHRDFRIRLADNYGRRSRVSMLVNRMYSWRGYQTDTGQMTTQRPNQITLAASKDSHVFGTLTVGLDSKSGLQVDALYRDKVDSIRADDRKVCEFIRLAVDPRYGSKDALASLFHVAFIYGCKINESDDILIEINPRHVAFYRRMLGFEQAGPERLCERVGAPAVLMRLPAGYAAEQIAQHGGHQTQGSRSLYPYFFSKREEDGLCARLQRLA